MHSSLLIVLLFLLSVSSSSAQTYNILSYGAKPDGKTDSTKAFTVLWAKACASVKPVTILVPKGRFLLRSIIFDGSKCKRKSVTFRIQGTLVAPSDYRVIGKENYWILFQHLDGISVYGGVLDAQGASLWSCKKSGKNCPSGATVRTYHFNVLMLFVNYAFIILNYANLQNIVAIEILINK